MGKVKVFLVAMLLVLSACAPSLQTIVQQATVGQPQEYQQGYYDGYSSAQFDERIGGAVFRKDAVRYLNDKLYQTGWDDGYRSMRASNEVLRNIMRNSNSPLGPPREDLRLR